MSVLINGQLEIDSERGVVYFHASEGDLAGGTVLRINSLPTPIPLDRQLDITPEGRSVVNWNGCRLHHQEVTLLLSI